MNQSCFSPPLAGLLPTGAHFTIGMAFCALSVLAVPHAAAENDPVREIAMQIHERVWTVDTHVDVPIVMQRPFFNIRKRHSQLEHRSQFDIPRMIEGGLDAAFFAVYLPQGPRTVEGRRQAVEQARHQFELIHQAIRDNSDILELATEADDAERIRQAGKRAVYIGIENGYLIGRDLDVLHEFFDLGARYMTLAHTRNNDISDSSTDRREHGGLSEFGRLVVKEMNKLGMMIDVSHISDDAALQAMELSRAPVLASHSSAYAIYPHPRNMNDHLLRRIAETGGVVHMNMFSAYLINVETTPERAEALRQWRNEFPGRISDLRPVERMKAAVEARARIDREHPPHMATLDDVMDHIDHIVKVAGIDHVGIGADLDGGGGVIGMNGVEDYPNITHALVKRGYTEEEIAKIWGKNLLRVMRANEALRETKR